VENFLRILLARGPANVSAIAFSRAVSNAMVGEISRRHHLRGPSSTVLGSSALAYAVDLLTDMRASAIVCVGVDEVRDLHLWAYRRAGLLAGGMVLGEGAAALVLERRDSAVARGAPIAASVLGSAMGFCPTSVHRITDVTGESLGECLLAALERASRSRADLDCVVAAASGHADLIDAEHRAVRSALGFDPVWLAPKRVFGESFGASEAIGVIVGVGALLESAEVESAVRLCAVNACQVGGGVSSIILGCGS
jgi:3-oxoacyl-(acyl-carrier-protein) synthase